MLPLKLDTPTMIGYTVDPRLIPGKNIKILKKPNDLVKPWDNSKENSPRDIGSTPLNRGSTVEILKDADHIMDPIKALLTNYKRRSDGGLDTIDDDYSPRGETDRTAVRNHHSVVRALSITAAQTSVVGPKTYQIKKMYKQDIEIDPKQTLTSRDDFQTETIVTRGQSYCKDRTHTNYSRFRSNNASPEYGKNKQNFPGLDIKKILINKARNSRD